MPDEVAGTAAEVAPDSNADGDAGKASEQAYLGTYRTREEAEKGLAEKEEFVRKAQSERDRLQHEKEMLMALLQDKAKEQPKPAEPTVDLDAIAKDIDENGGKAIVNYMARLQAEAERLAEQKATEKTKAAIERIEKLQAQLVESSSDWQAIKDEVAEYERLGVNREQAIQIARMRKPKVTTPAPMLRAGNTGGSRAAVEPEAKLDEADVAFLSSLTGIGKLSEDEKKALARKYGKKG